METWNANGTGAVPISFLPVLLRQLLLDNAHDDVGVNFRPSDFSAPLSTTITQSPFVILLYDA